MVLSEHLFTKFMQLVSLIFYRILIHCKIIQLILLLMHFKIIQLITISFKEKMMLSIPMLGLMNLLD